MLSFGPLCALGLISYGVYLWHWPIYVWLDAQRTHLDGWALVALRIAITIAVATLSYFLLEQPIRHGAIPARVLRPAVPALVGLLVVGLVFATASSSHEERVVADPIRVAIPQPAVERVLVVGNSVALFLADEGFKTLSTNPRIDVLNRGKIGCTIVPIERVRDAQGETLHVPMTWCRKDWDEAEVAFRPDLVVLTFAEPTDSQAEIDGSWTAPCEPLYDSRLEAELHDAIHLFASGGTHGGAHDGGVRQLPVQDARLVPSQRLPEHDHPAGGGFRAGRAARRPLRLVLRCARDGMPQQRGRRAAPSPTPCTPAARRRADRRQAHPAGRRHPDRRPGPAHVK